MHSFLLLLCPSLVKMHVQITKNHHSPFYVCNVYLLETDIHSQWQHSDCGYLIGQKPSVWCHVTLCLEVHVIQVWKWVFSQFFPDIPTTCRATVFAYLLPSGIVSSSWPWTGKSLNMNEWINKTLSESRLPLKVPCWVFDHLFQCREMFLLGYVGKKKKKR